jgi:hypothetical protein
LLTTGSVDAPAIIHFHATIYVGWLLIFLTQTVLPASGRIAAHTKLGNFAIGYGALVVAAGLIAAFGMFALRARLRRFCSRWRTTGGGNGAYTRSISPASR